MIPRLIHQTAPANQASWSPVWKGCQTTVQRIFQGYDYKMWTDDDLHDLVKRHFAWFYPIFASYPHPIYRADAGRYIILYLYGGIYIDMDYEILHDFYPRLSPTQPNIVESPFPNIEKTQNSLMASPPRHPFWMEVLKEMASCSTVFFFSVLDATGPRMLDRVIENTRYSINLLPMKEFNPPPIGTVYNANQWREEKNGKIIMARHKCSASWRSPQK